MWSNVYISVLLPVVACILYIITWNLLKTSWSMLFSNNMGTVLYADGAFEVSILFYYIFIITVTNEQRQLKWLCGYHCRALKYSSLQVKNNILNLNLISNYLLFNASYILLIFLLIVTL